MLIRMSIAVALTAAALLVAIGILVAPGAALGGLAFALLVAAGTTTYTRENSDSRTAAPSRRRRRTGLIAGSGTLAVWLLISGLVALFGPAAGVILLSILVPAVLIWTWWLVSTGFASWRPMGRRRPVPHPPAASPADLSTKALCQAWQRSQRRLREAPAGPARCEIVSDRQRLLDEMERRDSAGFTRWLATGACGGISPDGYLALD